MDSVDEILNDYFRSSEELERRAQEAAERVARMQEENAQRVREEQERLRRENGIMVNGDTIPFSAIGEHPLRRVYIGKAKGMFGQRKTVDLFLPMDGVSFAVNDPKPEGLRKMMVDYDSIVKINRAMIESIQTQYKRVRGEAIPVVAKDDRRQGSAIVVGQTDFIGHNTYSITILSRGRATLRLLNGTVIEFTPIFVDDDAEN